MPYFLYVYAPSDFVGGLPGESGAQAAGTPTFTLTLVPGAVPTLIEVDDDDAIFDEVDATQSLNAATVLDGTSYAAGTTINTAYDLINTGNGHRVTSFHFGGDGYQQGAVDGLVSTVPLVAGQSYTFNTERTSHQQANDYDDYVACFVEGSLIDTPDGARAVQDLRPGDLVTTLDGAAILRWHGVRQVAAVGAFAPVRLDAGALGLHRDLWVSQQHRMVMDGPQTSLWFGADAVFVPALHLCGDMGHVVTGGHVAYHHLLFDRHEVIFANGAATESLLPQIDALGAFGAAAQAEVLALFPELETAAHATALPSLRAHEARVLLN